MIERIRAGSFTILISEIIKNITGGVVLLLLTRLYLSPDEYGLLSLSIALFGAIHLLSNLGIPKAAARYISEYRGKDSNQIPWILFSAASMVILGIGISSLGILLLRGYVANIFRTPELYPLLGLGVFFIAFQGAYAYFRSAFQGFGRVEFSALIESIRGISNLGFITILVVFGYGVIGALAGYIAGYFLASLVGIICLSKLMPSEINRSEFQTDLPRDIFRYSIPLTVTKASNILYKRVDSIMIGFFLNPMAVGFYMLAKQISSFALAPATALGFTIAPIYGEKNLSEEQSEVADLYEDTLNFIFVLYLPATVGLIFVAEPLVRYLIGEAYLGSVPILQIFSIFLFINAVNQVTNDSLDYMGHAKERAFARGGSSVANFLLNLILIPLMGVIGAAIATVLSYGIMVCVNVIVVHRELDLHLRRILKRSTFSLVIVGILATYLSFMVNNIHGLTSLFIVILAAVAVWVICVLIYYYYTGNEFSSSI